LIGMDARSVAIIGSARDLDALTPLRRAYARRGIGEVVSPSVSPPAPGDVAELAAQADAVLLTYPRSRSPRTVVPWPAVLLTDGRRVPVGIVPAVGDSVERFAMTAASVHLRAITALQGAAGRGEPTPSTSVALLAQRTPRYIDLAGRIRRLLHERDYADNAVFWWPADEIVRDDVVQGLTTGLAVAVYVGHGRPRGWVGYAGVRAHHLAGAAEAGAVVVSLACQTLSRHHTGLSFSEALVVQGNTAAAIGAVSKTRHVANARWSLRIVDALAAGASTAGELLVAAEPDDALGGCYRLIGDPMAPLLDAPGGREAARALTDDVVWSPELEEVPS
jgi:Peptidase family C25